MNEEDVVPGEVCPARRDRPRRIDSQEAPGESDPETPGGGGGQCLTGQSPAWADDHVLGTDGGRVPNGVNGLTPPDCALRNT